MTVAIEPLGQSRSRAIARVAPDTVRARAFRTAKRHSLLVRLLRLALPAVALASFGLYFLGTDLSVEIGDGKATVERIELKSDNLKMINPSYEGYTDDQGRYVVKAASAIQDLKNRDRVQLAKITADLTQQNGDWARMTAAAGRFNIKSELLDLTGGIVVTTKDGMTAKLQTARANLKQRRVLSTRPVTVAMASGKVSALGIEILSEERRVVFQKDVVTELAPASGKAASAEPRRAGSLATAAFTDAPIAIRSQRLDVDDTAHIATFTGEVMASQAGTTLAAQTMRVRYAARSAAGGTVPAAPTAGQEIEAIETAGSVVITTVDGARLDAAWANFDRKADTASIGGGVVVENAAATVAGEELALDLATGAARFLPGGRVKTTLAATGSAEKPKGPAKDQLAASIGSFAGGSGEATEILSDTVDLSEAKGEAMFRGNVVVTQGAQTLKSDTLRVLYRAAPGATPQLTSIEARDAVELTSPNSQTAKGDWLTYDAKSEVLTLGGKVVVAQGSNIIKGEKLVIDLKAGTSRFELEQGGTQIVKKRVQMLIKNGQKALDQVGRGQ